MESSAKQTIDLKACGNAVEALTLSASNNFGVLRAILAVDNLESAMQEVESIRTAGQKLGMATLTHAANRLGAAILVGDAPNISRGMQTMEAVSREALNTLARLNQASAADTDSKVLPSDRA